MVIEPINDANNNFFNVVCLLNIIATVNSNIKSNPKFSNSIKSI